MLDELRTNRDKHELSKQVFVSLIEARYNLFLKYIHLFLESNFSLFHDVKKYFFPKLVEIVVEPRLQKGEPRPNSDHQALKYPEQLFSLKVML